jgi:hypothetical protein
MVRQALRRGGGRLSVGKGRIMIFAGLGEEKSETVPMIQAEHTDEQIADVTEFGSMNAHRDPGKVARG